MPQAVLGKTGTLHLATATQLVDLTPDYGSYSMAGTARAEAIMPAERPGVDRLLLDIDHSITIDSLRYVSRKPDGLDTGSAWQLVSTVGGGSFRSGLVYEVIVMGNGVTTPTDNLVDINLTPEVTGPWQVALGHLEPADDDPTAQGYTAPSDATGVVVWQPEAADQGSPQRSDWARSPKTETSLSLLSLGNGHGASATWTIEARRSDNWSTSLSSVALVTGQVNKARITTVMRPEAWADIDVDWRILRTPAAAGVPAAEYWLLGTTLRGE